VNFFPPKFFSGILEKGNLSEQEKILAGKNSLSKKGFSVFKVCKRFLSWINKNVERLDE
jgi:hypothetical protein